MIDIINLSKSYKKNTPVLNNINYSFNTGKIYGIVGNNGEGKTTLFNCIYGLINDYTGTITTQNQTPIKDICGYLPAENFFYARITGKEYVRYMAEMKAKKAENLEDWGNLLKLPLNDYISSYSTGMKKKIALLALILQDNQVYLLDEPFNGLDLISNLIIKSAIQKLHQKNKTILLSSHILGTLTDICDHILLISKGDIQAQYIPENFHHLEKDITNTYMQEKDNILEQLIS